MSEGMARQKWLGVEGISRYLQAGNKEPFTRVMLAVDVFNYLTDLWVNEATLHTAEWIGLRDSVGAGDDEIIEALELLFKAQVINLYSGDRGFVVETPCLQTWN